MYIIYGKNNCIWCDRAKEFLTQENEEFEFRNIEVNISARSEFTTKFPNVRTVPQIIHDVGFETPPYHIGGYEDLIKWYSRSRWE